MDKHIDESWKDSVDEEKHKQGPDAAKPAPGNIPRFELNFNTLVSSMAMEALIFLGELPNPATNKKEENLEQARYAIDMLSILKEKTKGNLTAEEANAMDNILYELKTKFVAKSK